MQNAISNKIRLLLNELAILNQPDMSGGKFIYNSEILKRIKSLSSELYLLSDASLDDTLKIVEVEKSETVVHATSAELQVSAPVVETKENIEIPPTPPEPILVEEPVVVEPIPAAIVEKTVVDIPTPEPVVIVEPPVVTPAPPPAIAEPVNTIESVSANQRFEGKISITRKFEYINNLFGGDATAFTEFLNRAASCSDVSAAIDVFNTHYEARNWKRKSETADDLKSLIKKSF
ncbi:MAG: hypothetical protein IT244_08965 [Bacteroidia bacterium]|nr:hypothetical protein [Bacteroidia bacterium]